MDAIEKAVRNALEKGDAEDKNYRRRVYVSARSALERSMAGRQLEQALVDQRFSRLAEVAATIESEFLPAVEEFGYPMPGRRSYEAPPPSVESVPDAASALDGSPEREAHVMPAADVVAEVDAAAAVDDASIGTDPVDETMPIMESYAHGGDAFASAEVETHQDFSTVANESESVEHALAGMPSPEEVVAETPMVPAATSQGKRKTSAKKLASAEFDRRVSEDMPQEGVPDLFGISEPAENTPPVLSETGDLTHLSPDELSGQGGQGGQEQFGVPDSFAASGAEQSAPMQENTPDLFETVSESEAQPEAESSGAPAGDAAISPVAADESGRGDIEVEAGDSERSATEEVVHATEPAVISAGEENGDVRATVEPDGQGDLHFEVRPVAEASENDGADSLAADAASQPPAAEPKRGWGFVFILVTLLAMLTMGLWVAYTTGSLKLRSADDTQSGDVLTVDPRDEPDAPGADATPAGQPSGEDWLMIFRPDNPGDLVVDPTIRAAIEGAGPLAHLRIEPAASAGNDAAVVFSIGKGILEQIAGKSAVFDIVAAADDGNPNQISVLCDFAGLGDCGRKRYRIDAATSDNLFQIELPEGAPDGDGQIIINPDVDGKGRPLEIYAIRVRIADN